MPNDLSSAPIAALSSALTGLVAAVAPFVVAVHTARSRSSGFLWRSGLVVTAEEALADEGDVTVVLPGGAAVPASVAGRDASTDIALLRIDRPDLSPLPAAAAAPASVGALMLVVGGQEGGATAALGVVALAGGAWRSMRGGEIDARIELNLALRSSAEGGVVIDAGGHLVGMAVFGPRRRVLVIPSATIERVAGTLATHGRVPRGYLGLALQPVALDNDAAGAMVMSVDANGPAAAAGVCQGDVIAAWNGQPIGSLRALVRGLGPDKVGETVDVQLRRTGTTLTLRLTIGERPPA